MAVRFSMMPITPVMQAPGPVLPSIPSPPVTLPNDCTATLTAHQLASLKSAVACGYRVDLLAARLGDRADRLAVLLGERHAHNRRSVIAGEEVVRAFPRRAVETEQFAGMEHPVNVAAGFLRLEFYGSLVNAAFLAAPPPELADEARKFVRAKMDDPANGEFQGGLRLSMRKRGYSRSVDLSSQGLETFLKGSNGPVMDGSPVVYLEKGLERPVVPPFPLWRIAMAVGGILAAGLGARYTQPLLSLFGFVATVYGVWPFVAWGEYITSDTYVIDYRNLNMAINLAGEVMQEEREDPLLSILGSAHNRGLSEILMEKYDFRRIPIP